MADENRFELDINAVDNTGPATASANKNIRSVEQEHARAAQRIAASGDTAAAGIARSASTWKQYLSQNLGSATKEFGSHGEAMRALSQRWKEMGAAAESAGVQISQAASTVSEATLRRLQRLMDQMSLAGKSPMDRLRYRMEQDMQRFASQGLDEAGLQKVRGVWEARIGALKQRQVDSLLTSPVGRGSESQRLTGQMESQLKQLAGLGVAEELIAKRRKEFQSAIRKAEEEVGHGGSSQAIRRTFLGLKDFAEGSTRGAIIEGTDVLIGTSGRGGILPNLITKVSEFAGVSRVAVIAAGSLAAGLAALGIAGIGAMKGLGERAQEIRNFSTRTGIAPTRVQAFQFAATAEGVKPESLERMSRGLSEMADDYSPAGERARRELERLPGGGVRLRDELGDLKPTEQIILEIADAINKLPPGLQQSGAMMEVLKRIGIEMLPVFVNLRENMKISDQIGGTLTDSQLRMAEQWDKTLKTMGERWARFKTSVEFPLAILGNFTLKIFGVVSDLVDAPVKAAEAVHERIMQYIRNPSPNRPAAPSYETLAERPQKLRDRQEADALIKQDQASQGVNAQLEKARKEYQSLPELHVGESSLKDTREKVAAGRRVQQLEAAEKAQSEGMRGVIEARKERLQLEAQHAEIQESTVQKTLLAGLDTKKELLSPDDIKKMLEAAEARANAESQKFLKSHSEVFNEKTGQIEDLSKTAGYRKTAAEEAINLPLRIRNEYDKVLSEVRERDTKYFKDRSDADFKAFDEAQKRKVEAQKSLYEETKQLEADLRTQYYQQQSSTIERQKSLALQQLGLRDAQTPQERIRLADAQFGVETYYSRQALALQESKLTADRDIELGKQQAQLSIAGPAGQDDYDRNVALISQRYSNEIDAARQAESEKELIDAQKTSNEKAKITIEATKSVYQNLKEEANGLFDVLFSRTKSWADFGKQLLKTFVLTPVKDIFSSQVAGVFTQALTGQKVSFNEIGNGQGPIGRVGGLLGRLGMGSPRFGDRQAADASKLNLPNHLGDVTLVSSSGGTASSSVPVVIANVDELAQSHAQVRSQQQGRAQTAFAPLTASVGSLTRAVEMRALPSPVPQTAVVRPPVESVASRLITDAGSDYGPFDVSQLPLNAETQAPNYQIPNLDRPTPVESVSSRLITAVVRPLVESVSSRLITGGGSDFGPVDLSPLSLNALTQAANYRMPNLGMRPPVESAVSRLITSDGSDFGPADFSQLPLNAITQAPSHQFPDLGIPSPIEDFSSRFITSAGSSYGPATQSVVSDIFGNALPGAPAFSNVDVSSLPLNAVAQSPAYQIPNLDAATSGGSKGILSKIGGLGSLSGLKSMFGLDTSGTDMGGGVGIARQGFGGNLAAISKSSGFAMLGGMAAMDGIRRGGVAGTIEAAGGGAMVGFKFGGPIGAAVGAAVGAGAALIKTFIGDDRSHTKDLVKQIYGISINNAMADQIIQIAKQSYGGQISMAVRSQQVRDLLRLYAQTTGDTKGQAQFVADKLHSASLVESNGKLMQQAIYDNGQAYSYQSPLSVYGGVQTSPLQTYAPNQGVFSGNLQISLNGQSAADVLGGQVVKVATPSFVQGQALAASNASNGRTSQRNLSLSPSALSS